MSHAPAGQHELAADPVFIVCNARSGSTLLRYLLDVHPELACPAETKVMPAARALLNLHNDLAGNPTTELLVRRSGVPEPTARSVAQTRAVIVGIVNNYLARRGRTVWVDKSLEAVESLKLLGELFPTARYLCLHRHAMDVVASLHESCRWGYGYFEVAPYVQRRLNNVPLAFAEYWTVRTNLMLRLQQSPARTHAVHYEHLVRDPVPTLTAILRFLGVADGPDVVDAMLGDAFVVEHDPGAADWKIPFSDRVAPTSVGRGRAVPHELIKDPVREQMNALLAMLRYPQVDDRWNVSSEVAPRTDPTLLDGVPAEVRVGALVENVVAARLRAQPGPHVRPFALVATYGAGAADTWVVDHATASIRRHADESPPPLRVTTRAEVLHAILAGGLPAQSAQRLDMIDIDGVEDEPERRAIARLLSAILAG